MRPRPARHHATETVLPFIARLVVSFVTFFVLLCAISASANAASLQEAQNLLRQGETAQALEQTEKLLSANPKDRSAHFLKGVILTEMNKLDEAIAVFTALTKEAPELPEPYNNLAVIYAQQRQYDKAKAALEMAIRTHPSYAVAHENLGDLYSKMARQAYDRALQIDASNTAVQTKLSLIRDIHSLSARNTALASTRPATSPTIVASVAMPAPQPKPVAPPPEPAVIAKAKPPTPAPVSVPTSAPASAAVKPPAPAAASATKVIAPAETQPAAKASKSEDVDVRKAILAWAEAWSRKDMKGYFSAYAKDFQVPGGASRSAWEKERTERVGKPGTIRVTLTDIKVDVIDSKATVRFRQHYTSTNLTTSSGKTLVMVQRNGRWLIQQEKIGR